MIDGIESKYLEKSQDQVEIKLLLPFFISGVRSSAKTIFVLFSDRVDY